MSEVVVCRIDELEDPGCREFRAGDDPWPFRGFVVRQANAVFAYRNHCAHAGHPLNWQPDRFLTEDGRYIICSSHGAEYDIASGGCVAGPCRGKRLDRLPVEIREGAIVVRIDDPATG